MWTITNVQGKAYPVRAWSWIFVMNPLWILGTVIIICESYCHSPTSGTVNNLVFILFLCWLPTSHHHLLNSISGIIKNDKTIITSSIFSLWSIWDLKQGSDTWQMGRRGAKFTLISWVMDIHSWEPAKEIIREGTGMRWFAQAVLAIAFHSLMLFQINTIHK